MSGRSFQRLTKLSGSQRTISRDTWLGFLLLEAATPEVQPLLLLVSLLLAPGLALLENLAENRKPRIALGGREQISGLVALWNLWDE